MRLGAMGARGGFGSAGVLGSAGWWARPSNNLIGDDGDSRMDNGQTLTASARYFVGVGFPAWALALGSNPALYRIESSYGTAGDTVALMNARKATTFADTNVGAFVVLCGTNTFAGAGGDTPEVLAQAKVDFAEYLDAAGVARKIIFLIAETPRLTTDGGGTISPAAYANLILFHIWLRDVAAVGRPWVRVVDMWPVLADGSDVPLAGMLRDGLHPAFLGAKTGGSPLLTALNAFYGSNSKFLEPSSDSSLYNASTNPSGSLVTNPLLTGTGGSIGSGWTNNGLAASWSLNRNTAAAAMTFTCSKDGTTGAQVIDFSGTPTGSGPNATLFQAINVANLSLDDILRGFVQIECISLTNVERVSAELVLTATQNCTARDMAAFSGQTMPSDQTLKLLSPTLPITTGFSAVQLSIVISFVQNAACSGTIKVSQATARKVAA
jgi:hypothetical protein